MIRFKLLLLLILALAGYEGSAQLAQISSVTPSSILTNTMTDLTVRGVNTHFQRGISVAKINGTNVHINVANTVTATVTLQGLPKGSYTLEITTRNETVTYVITIFTAPATAITAEIQILSMETISLKNIDLSNPSQTPVLFNTMVYNNDTPRTIKDSIVVTSGSRGYIGTMTKTCFPIAPNATANYTNQQFSSVSVPSGSDFLTQVELTGAFPPDNYTYILYVVDCNARKILTTASTTTILTNPLTNPSLITPGAAFNDNVPAMYNPMPLFQWFGQNDRYDFAVYEWRAGQTAEEAVRNVAVYKQTDVSGNSLLYPNSAEKLINGMTYAWQVQGKVVSANGTRYLPSDVYRFVYTDAQATGIRLVASIQMTPDEISIGQGGQYQFKAVCYDEQNVVIPDAKLTWSVSPNYGTVTQSGLFTAGAAGNTVAVLVSAGSATEFATVTINPDSGNSYLNPFQGFVKKLFGLQ